MWVMEYRSTHLRLAEQGLLELLTGLAAGLSDVMVGHELLIDPLATSAL